MKICGGGRRTSMRKRRFKRLPSRLCHPPTIFVCEREKERERELLECSRVDEVLLEKKSEDRSPDEVLEKIYR